MNAFAKPAMRLLTLFVVLLLAVGAFSLASAAGWLSVFGLRSDSQDTQVVQAIERTQEVSLLSLAIQGISSKEQNSTFLGHDVPGSGETLFLQYEFSAKLGIDGSQVRVDTKGENSYEVTIPDFIFIGYDDPTFKVAAEDGGILSFTTKDIDEVEMVNEILDKDARGKYLDQNEELLRDQAKVFYESLITSIEPDADVTFVYAS